MIFWGVFMIRLLPTAQLISIIIYVNCGSALLRLNSRGVHTQVKKWVLNLEISIAIEISRFFCVWTVLFHELSRSRSRSNSHFLLRFFWIIAIIRRALCVWTLSRIENRFYISHHAQRAVSLSLDRTQLRVYGRPSVKFRACAVRGSPPSNRVFFQWA